MSLPDEDDLMLPKDPVERATVLQNLMIANATHEAFDESIYLQLRKEYMQDSSTKNLLPKFIRTSRSSRELWAHFKGYADTYRERRVYIYNSFQPLLEFLERREQIPSDVLTTEKLRSLEFAAIQREWEKALAKRVDDPEGAISSARTLLETVCMHILDESGIDYSKFDLPELYKHTAELLNLAPTQHEEEYFKKILGGCHVIVENLGTLRNKIGDAHGKGRSKVRPAPRHAALAVNLAGTMTTFIVETWKHKDVNQEKK